MVLFIGVSIVVPLHVMCLHNIQPIRLYWLDICVDITTIPQHEVTTKYALLVNDYVFQPSHPQCVRQDFCYIIVVSKAKSR